MILADPNVGAVSAATLAVDLHTQTSGRSGDLFARSFGHSAVATLLCDDSGRVTLANAAALTLLAYQSEDLLGVHFDDFTHPHDRGRWTDAIGRLADGGRLEFEKRYISADDRIISASVSVSRLALGTEHLRMVQILDRAELHHAQERRDRERRTLAQLVELQHDLTDAIGDEGRVMTLLVDRVIGLFDHCDGAVILLPESAVNGQAATLAYAVAGGLLAGHVGNRVDAHHSLAGRAHREGSVLAANDVTKHPDVDIEACRRTGVASMIVLPLRSATAGIGVLKLASIRPNAFDETDEHLASMVAHALSGALAQSRAFTHASDLLRQAQNANRLTALGEERYALGFKHCPQAMLSTTIDSDEEEFARSINAAFAKLVGDVGGEALEEIHRSNLHCLSTLDQAWDCAAPAEIECTNSLPSARGLRIVRAITVVCVIDDNAQVRPETDRPIRHAVTTFEDVTDHDAVARRLAERDRILENANDAILARGLDGRIQYWNPGAERLYGWSSDAAVGRDLDRLLATGYPEGMSRASIEQELEMHGRWAGSVTHRRRDGRLVEVNVKKAILRDPNGVPEGVLSVSTDVTAQRAAERALSASEELFRSQFEHSAIGQVIRRLDDTIESVNPAFASMLGYPNPETLAGVNATSLAGTEQREQRNRALAEVFAGDRDSISFEAVLRHRDGHDVPVHYTGSVVRDDHGAPVRFISHFYDISRRRAAELERDKALAELRCRHDELESMNDSLERLGQMKSDLISMLGHEIKNPLAVLLMATDLARETWTPGAGTREDRYLGHVHRNTLRIQATVDQVLAMMAAESGRLLAYPEPVDVGETIQAALSQNFITQPAYVSPGLVAYVQPDHLSQMVTNLITNAVKYADARFSIRAAQAKGAIEVDVIDHGPGVPDGFIDQLFDRFTRADDMAQHAKGSGVGLFLVRELARANGGDITHRPTSGGGATFTISLPDTGPIG